MKKIEIELVSFIVIIIMIICLAIACFVYYERKINDCTSNPLVYASKMYERNTGYALEGLAFFITPPDVKSMNIYFNSTKTTIS